MTASQLRWAAQHDWFISVVYDDIENESGVYVRGCDSGEVIDCFFCFDTLKEWAGY